MGTKVTLRQKPISGNRQSLYLDFYPPIINPETGKQTRREFLNLFLFDEYKHEEVPCMEKNGKPKIGKNGKPVKKIIKVISAKTGNPIKVNVSLLDGKHNESTLQYATQIQQKRENSINKPEIYTGFEKEQLRIKERGDLNFVEYFKGVSEKHKNTTDFTWIASYKYLEAFTGGRLKFSDIDEKFCNDFRTYLTTAKGLKNTNATMSANTIFCYFSRFKFALGQAKRDGFLNTDINANVKNTKQAETHRNYLSLEELNLLVKTECKVPILKRAALFSAMTGLRFSDVKKLAWGEIEYIEGNGHFIKFTQQKTKGIEMMPISEQAYNLLGEPKQPDKKVFDGLVYSNYSNLILTNWVLMAGITKSITFHCFRHTFATLQLSAGTDIYTVSKMLGHRDLKTTQIYANVIDKSKRDASNRISLNF